MEIELPEKITIYFVLITVFYIVMFFVSLFYLIIPCKNLGLALNFQFLAYLVLTFLPLPFLWYYLDNEFEEEWKPRIVSCVVMLVCGLIICIDVLPVVLFW